MVAAYNGIVNMWNLRTSTITSRQILSLDYYQNPKDEIIFIPYMDNY
jgi:hypothetical protein